jgi:glycosyltransferase involved in cell wall biosynthesis
MIGCVKRKKWELVKYIFLIPFYWIMASVASVIAFYQLITKPYYWEKTKHGLHLTKRKRIIPKLELQITFTTFIPNYVKKFLGFLYKPFWIILKNTFDIIDIVGPLPLKARKQGKLNILVFNWRDIKHTWSGGAEVYVHELARNWVKMGHNVTIFVGWDGKTKRAEKVDGIQIIRRGGFFTIYPLALLYYIFRLRGNFDIVVDSENGIPFFTPLFVKVPKVLLLYHIHQEILRKYLPFPLSHLAMFLESRVTPNLYRNESIVTISESSKKDLVDLNWFKPNNIEIVNPAIESDSLKKGPKTNKPSFVYLGRLKPYKNIDIAIKAFAQVNKKFPSSTLTIAGFGESLSDLKQLTSKLGVENKVSFPGKVSEGQKAKLFSQSWAAIQPSSVEGWGITVIEANACGTPVVASNVKGLSDSVVNGKTGILFPVGNFETLSTALETLIVDKKLRQGLSKNAYSWSKNFSWTLSSNMFEQILLNAVKPKKLLSTKINLALDEAN